jgi:SAM-dependent methyltransferase
MSAASPASVIRRIVKAIVPRPAVNAGLRWTRAMLGPVGFDALMGRGHRQPGYRLLRGEGIEIGALHAPAPLPAGCRVRYVDAITTEEARRLFPEVDAARMVPVGLVTDLDVHGLAGIADNSCDFAVMNHVIEHLANPIRAIEELFRVVRPGGYVVISAPDMRFTFDRGRRLTTAEHLLEEYAEGVDAVGIDHYQEFVHALMPNLDEQEFARQVSLARERREHAHVWNSSTFRTFLTQAHQASRVQARLLCESVGDRNGLEHFSVWEKVAGPELSID